MNKKKIFATILCGVFGLSIASGALVANFAHDEEPTIAASDATRLYVIPGTNWSSVDADIAAYIYGGTTTATWYPLETIEGLDNKNILATPEIANLSEATNVIFGRFAGGTNDNSSWGFSNPHMWNRSPGSTMAIELDIAKNNIYRIDNGAWGNLDDNASGFSGYWLDFMFDDDLVERTREIGVKFDGVDYSSGTMSWYGYTATNGLQGDQIYAMSGTLTRNENGIYVGSVSSSINHIQFHDGNWLIKTDYTELQNFAKYAQADQLPLYTITNTEYGNMWRGSWGGNGTSHAPNTKYARLWYSHGNYYKDGFLHTLHYWKSTGVDVEVLPTEYVAFGQNNDQWLTYFDVKLDDLLGANIQFKIYNNTTGAFQVSTITNEGTIYSNGNNAHIYYLYDKAGQWHYSNNGSLNEGVQVTGKQLAKVFEAYYTCKNDANNGFASIETLKTTWHVEEETDYTDTFNDYANGDTTYTSNRINSISVQDKISAMEGQLALANNSTSPAFFSSITNNSQTIIIVVIALTAIASITALVVYSIKRRKEENNR